MTPDVDGPHRLVAAGFGRTRLLIDGHLVAENATDPFPAGLGLTGGAATFQLEAGRAYEVVLEQEPKPDERPVALTDVQVALPSVDPEAQLREAERVAAEADVAVVVVGSNGEWESEGSDRSDLLLPAGQDELVRRVVAANARTVVVLNCGAPMQLPWLDQVSAAILAWYPGQEGGDAIFDVLVGEADPGGRMPTTWARSEADTPSFGHYPGADGRVEYGEGLLVGHRWYDAQGIEPLIPFGHGGSYATFDWGEPNASGTGTDVVVDVPVTNCGDRRGAEVVQVYVAAIDPAVARPPKVLGGFAKVHLEPGETATARVELGPSAFSRWDVDTSAWQIDPGAYDLVVASSATVERFRIRHVIESDGAE
jgi:beta-glucosidase